MKNVAVWMCVAAAVGLGAGSPRAQMLELPPEVQRMLLDLLELPGQEAIESVTIDVQRSGKQEPEVYKLTVSNLVGSDGIDCLRRRPNYSEYKKNYQFVWCRESSGNAQRDTYWYSLPIPTETQNEVPCQPDETPVHLIPWPRVSETAHDRIC